MKIRAILVPVFDWGQAITVLIIMGIFGVLAIFTDPLLGLFMGVGAYVGMVVNTFLRGVAPDEIDIQEIEVRPISTILNSERLIAPIGDRVWAPLRYGSSWWKSNRISIVEDPPGRFRLLARRRDLKVVLAKLRRQGLR
jgi:hypothetical protein